MQTLVEENEGLRKGLQEILNFLKGVDTVKSGMLAMECPSLEAVLRSMEARHAAGWFAPHMATLMDLKAAVGGRDALLTALNDARKETYEVMRRLTKESEKASELEIKIKEIESQKPEKNKEILTDNEFEIIGSWISDTEQKDIDIFDKNAVENMVSKMNYLHEKQLKTALEYFYKKFKTLFDKMTTLTILVNDKQNDWSILEENYKAQIENLKGQLTQGNMEDVSDDSAGLVKIPNIDILQRKCFYLEETYRNLRTSIENIRNEYLEFKRDSLITEFNYETHIQKLILRITNLTDYLRRSIPQELFWKHHQVLNETLFKYRKVVVDEVRKEEYYPDLFKRLENNREEIINGFKRTFHREDGAENMQQKLFNIEKSIIHNQLHELCNELEVKNKVINSLEIKCLDLQEAHTKLIDNSLATLTKEEIDLIKERINEVTQTNDVLKEQCKHVEQQLEIALLQLQDSQHRKMSYDMETNMLRHQILDLQASGDNKAIIARLSSEVLLAQMQAAENCEKMKKINSALNKEKQLRAETEEVLRTREKVFEVYVTRHETKFRYMYEVMQILRQEYQGSLPLVSVENYLNNLKNVYRKNQDLHKKLDEVEDLRFNLMAKHNAYDEILRASKNKCSGSEDLCSYKLKYMIMESVHSRELDHLTKKITTLEVSRQELSKQCKYLERNLILVSQGFEKPSSNILVIKHLAQNGDENSELSLRLEDLASDDDNDTSSRKSQTKTLSDPQVLKVSKTVLNTKEHYINKSTMMNVSIQTTETNTNKVSKIMQTEIDHEINELKHTVQKLETDLENNNKKLTETVNLAQQRTEEILRLKSKINTLDSLIQNLKYSNYEKEKSNKALENAVANLEQQLEHLENVNIRDSNNIKTKYEDQNNFLLHSLKQLEIDKNNIAEEYKELLKNEREKYAKSIKDLQLRLSELQTELDRRNEEPSSSNATTIKEVINKYTQKNIELEEKCFKLQSELDGCNTELINYNSEVSRWKELASERLNKMEQLSSQLKERHSQEVESYKAENQHWLSQLNETQSEHMELRSQLMEQKAVHVKQLADKDAHIEQLRSVINSLKSQMINMQTLISVNDPTFDLSAIVEVDEASDAVSPQESDRLELKFNSVGDLQESQEDVTVPASSTAIWQETLIERLRREKQFAGKQNAILRRQIKIIAARERRARLDAQNLKNQVYRISTSSSRVTTVETAALHSKIASLQAQLTSARRDTHSSVALWDKWKRAQQSSERWQARYEEKCMDVKKLETVINLTKSAATRLEREKRVLLARLSEAKNDKQLAIEKQDSEESEKLVKPSGERISSGMWEGISQRALLDRVQAQQRRITALQYAEKGNEILVSEYEKSLAEITALKGQILKLESALLESQIRSPLKDTQESQSELEYWKSYCSMLKDENVQLTQKVSALESAPVSATQHRISDLEQTVLTLRGLVSKLQAEQKSNVTKRMDSRPSSSRSFSDKSRYQLESWRIEVANLKKSIHDKDLLLERSREMLKIAAEREDELLREIATLRRRLREVSSLREGFLSA